MDNYEILGVSSDSSMEEIKAAYERKIAKIDNEVVNVKNAEAFKKILKDAYDGLTIHNSTENTIVMTKEDFQKFAMKQAGMAYNDDTYEDEYSADYDDDYEDEYGYDEDGYEDDGYDDDEYDDYYYDHDDEEEEKPARQRRSSRYNKKNKKSSSKKKSRNDRRRNDEDEFDHERRARRHTESHESSLPWFIKLPMSIIIMPFIIVFSVIVFIFDIINAVLWAATKILLIGSAATAIAYGVLIYKGIMQQDNRVLIACAAVFGVSLILPPIVKLIPKPLEILNNKLKAFVF